MWIWALLGREHAPLPHLDVPVVDHGHDLMAGSLFARLAGRPDSYDLADFRAFRRPRLVTQSLARGRRVTASIGANLMIGAEASDSDWDGWEQFLPATAHWRSRLGAATLWLVDAHVVHAVASDHRLTIDVSGELRFHLCSTDAPVVSGSGLAAVGMSVMFAPNVALSAVKLSDECWEIGATSARGGPGVSVELRFAEVE